jgi:transposase, IS5 family
MSITHALKWSFACELTAVNAKLIDRDVMLKIVTVLDATLISAPSSTKNDKGEHDPEG